MVVLCQTRLAWAFLVGLLASPVWAATVNVSSVAELEAAVSAANASGGNVTILLADGTYTVDHTLNVTAPDVTISSQSGQRDKVIVQGDAMSANAAIVILIRAAASNFTVSNLTLQKCGAHLLQVVGELGANNAVVHNVVFRDAYQQLLKVSVDTTNYAISGNNGLVEDSLFEYTAGVGPEYYIGGIDIHDGKNWIVRRNTFRSIISPDTTVAEFAIHFWNQSADALVERNLIINCDRGIGFGLNQLGNTRGIIRNNMIYHAANDGQSADVGIYLEDSPGTQVYNNSIFMENSYPNAIEYRYALTAGVLIENNLSNKAIAARDGATGSLASNVLTAQSAWFVSPSTGNLRLTSAVPGVVRAGLAVPGLIDDFFGASRPAASPDVGAAQYAAATLLPPTNLHVVP